MGRVTKRILITDASVARLAPAKIEAGYVVRDRDLRGFIVKVGMRRKTYRYEGEQRNGRQRKVISRKLGEHPHTKAGDARAAWRFGGAGRCRFDQLRGRMYTRSPSRYDVGAHGTLPQLKMRRPTIPRYASSPR